MEKLLTVLSVFKERCIYLSLLFPKSSFQSAFQSLKLQSVTHFSLISGLTSQHHSKAFDCSSSFPRKVHLLVIIIFYNFNCHFSSQSHKLLETNHCASGFSSQQMILGETLVILGGESIYFSLSTDMSVPSITNYAKFLTTLPAYLQVK